MEPSAVRMGRRDRISRFLAPTARVLTAAVILLLVGVAAGPFDGGALALWAVILGLALAPVLTLIMIGVGVRLWPARTGFRVGAGSYSAVFALLFLINLVSSI